MTSWVLMEGGGGLAVSNDGTYMLEFITVEGGERRTNPLEALVPACWALQQLG